MNSNFIIDKEKEFIDRISDKYNYDSNIRHLLYLMIPAFIIKYGINREKLVLNVFENIRIITSNKKDSRVKAYYSSRPTCIDGNYKTEKTMVIINYEKISLIDLLDNLVHEFNHAINSYLNEIKVTNKYLYIRTGLTNIIYRKEDLSFIKKDNSFILEEIIILNKRVILLILLRILIVVIILYMQLIMRLVITIILIHIIFKVMYVKRY